MSKAQEKYFEAVGRRKTAVARVRLVPAAKEHFAINDRTLKDYFPLAELQATVRQPLVSQQLDGHFVISVKVRGGGLQAQAEALALGLARALVEKDTALRPGLKKGGFLKRDPRAKERRKFGLKKARKSPQWSKR